MRNVRPGCRIIPCLSSLSEASTSHRLAVSDSRRSSLDTIGVILVLAAIADVRDGRGDRLMPDEMKACLVELAHGPLVYRADSPNRLGDLFFFF